MIEDRLIALINNECPEERTRYKDFAEKTGIKKETLRAICNQKQRVNAEHIEAIASTFPQYKFWFVFDEVHPEIGQISPELDQTAGDYQGTGTDT